MIRNLQTEKPLKDNVNIDDLVIVEMNPMGENDATHRVTGWVVEKQDDSLLIFSSDPKLPAFRRNTMFEARVEYDKVLAYCVVPRQEYQG